MEINKNNNPAGSNSSTKTERKFVERNRRNQMKALYCKLNSLLPRQASREGICSLPDQLEEATNYIKKLQVKVEKMKEKKNALLIGRVHQTPNIINRNGSSGGLIRSPEIEIQQMGSTLMVVLITGLDCHFMFNEAIRILHEEGADVVSATYKVVHQHAVFHTMHCQQVNEYANGVGARISERLKKFVNDSRRLHAIIYMSKIRSSSISVILWKDYPVGKNRGVLESKRGEAQEEEISRKGGTFLNPDFRVFGVIIVCLF
ncbi:hypothetical protein PIB30_035113 [Stylosanthes scabra]|uniref:BHLH domain-containing protein n=1 Tax=Stylosanthes scabra TaxID=79078 RepID=A0ABU6SD70_9FABA|nr:hypothetical protein [Stylosanthes scabra]